MADNEHLERLIKLPSKRRLTRLRKLSHEERRTLHYHWRLWARDEQVAPPGDWRLWLIMAGRGFGKTRAGAEWVREIAERTPEARIALVGGSLGEARAVMVEGESGLLAVSAPGQLPLFEPSLRRLTWPNGAQALLYSAQEPESLRGPQHSHACRPIAEGSVRQRGPCTGRRAAPLRNRRRGFQPSPRPGRRRGLADLRRAFRDVDGTRGPTGVSAGRKLAFRHPPRRPARAQPIDGPGVALSWRMASAGGACGTFGRFGR